MKQIFLITTLIVGLVSCKKNAEELKPTEQSNYDVAYLISNIDASNRTGDFIFDIRRNHGQTAFAQSTAWFRHSPLNSGPDLLDNVGDVSISSGNGAFDLLIDSDNAYKVTSSNNSSLANSNGVDLNINIEGGGSYQPFSQTIYMPTLVDFQGGTGNINTHNGSDLNVQWNTDPNYNNGTVVVLKYEVVASNERDATMPDENYQWHVIIDDAAGSATIPSSAFNSYPAGAFFTITLARGNAELVNDTSGNLTSFIVYNYCNSKPFSIE